MEFEFQCETRLKYARCHIGHLIWFWIFLFCLLLQFFYSRFHCCKRSKQASRCFTLYINRHFIQVMFPPLPLPPPACCVRLGAMTNSKHSWQVYKHIKHILIHSNINMVCVRVCDVCFFFCISWNTISQFHGQMNLNVLFICRAIVAGGG